jgi:hypothetical protein
MFILIVQRIQQLLFIKAFGYMQRPHAPKAPVGVGVGLEYFAQLIMGITLEYPFRRAVLQNHPGAPGMPGTFTGLQCRQLCIRHL